MQMERNKAADNNNGRHDDESQEPEGVRFQRYSAGV